MPKPLAKKRGKLSPYRAHVAKWEDCDRCPLCETRRRVVLARGKLPCDILFVGEAPGGSEDVHGQPFIGPAGRLLDHLIQKAIDAAEVESPRLAFTNLVACLPIHESGKSDPTASEIKACKDRLVEFVRIASPKRIVAVGSLSSKWLPKLIDREPDVSIVHPASILRGVEPRKTFEIDQTFIRLAQLFEDWRT